MVAASVALSGREAQPGTALGLTLGTGVVAVAWAFGAVVLSVLAIATKPSPSVSWPRPTVWVTAVLTILVFMWPIYAANKAASGPPARAAAGGPGSGHAQTWSEDKEVSPMDGSRTVTLGIRSQNQIQAWLSQQRPALAIRCREHKTDVYVEVGTEASVESPEGYHTVRLRLDAGRPFTQRWSESTNGEALFAPNGKLLAADLAKHRTLTFGFTPFDANPVVATFDLTGLDSHIGDVERACGWRAPK